MLAFADTVIKPLLTRAKARTVVEIGAAGGENTDKLLHWAIEHRAVLHVVDPMPAFDVGARQRRYGRTLVMHRTLSLLALPEIHDPDVVLIDGDHNWYTVFQELRLLERYARWPITLLHDVDWPYGRRDMYYAPDTVPAQYRQPHTRSGIVRGEPALSPGGMNADYENAVLEGGPRNGVLTAVEDFMDLSRHALELFVVPGPEGLAILIDRERLKGRVRDLVQSVHDEAFARRLSPEHASRFFSGAVGAQPG